jgi:hypothetical protein
LKAIVAAALLSIAAVAAPAFANVAPTQSNAGRTEISAPKAATLVAPNILPRLLLTSMRGR